MKKNPTKLQLHRETLHNLLDNAGLRDAAGGVTTTTVLTQGESCLACYRETYQPTGC
jgi:hypothetical protein